MDSGHIAAIVLSIVPAALLWSGIHALVTERLPLWPARLMQGWHSPVSYAVMGILIGAGLLIANAAVLTTEETPMEATGFALVFLGLTLGLFKEHRTKRQASTTRKAARSQ